MMEKPESLWLARYCDALASTGAHDAVAYSQAAAKLRRLHEQNEELLAVLLAVQSQCVSMAGADWRKWEELASAEEFERWVKSRAAHMAVQARAAIAKAEGK